MCMRVTWRSVPSRRTASGSLPSYSSCRQAGRRARKGRFVLRWKAWADGEQAEAGWQRTEQQRAQQGALSLCCCWLDMAAHIEVGSPKFCVVLHPGQQLPPHAHCISRGGGCDAHPQRLACLYLQDQIVVEGDLESRHVGML